jgi:uncharacterized membrane protein YdjX (TVP38/TMEM64 family)
MTNDDEQLKTKEMKQSHWYKNPDGVTKVVAFGVLIILCILIWHFGGREVRHTFRLAVSGNVEGLALYLRSFGPWALIISFLLDVIINAGSVFPSIFLSTANGLIFGLPIGITVSWLAETTGVVLSFLLMRFFFRDSAEELIKKAHRLEDIDKASEKDGVYWMTFARALPYFPSGILTAIGAVSRMSVKDYVIANLIGKFPSTALEVVIGHDVVQLRTHMFRLTVLIILVAIIFYVIHKYVLHKKSDK